MATRKIKLDQLPDVIAEICREYSDSVALGVSERTIAVAEAGARAINTSAAMFGGKKYRRSWTVQVEGKRYRSSATIHSTNYQVAHLLEKSHSAGPHRKGSYSGRPHIEPVEQRIIKEYTNEIEKIAVIG